MIHPTIVHSECLVLVLEREHSSQLPGTQQLAIRTSQVLFRVAGVKCAQFLNCEACPKKLVIFKSSSSLEKNHSLESRQSSIQRESLPTENLCHKRTSHIESISTRTQVRVGARRVEAIVVQYYKDASVHHSRRESAWLIERLNFRLQKATAGRCLLQAACLHARGMQGETSLVALYAVTF